MSAADNLDRDFLLDKEDYPFGLRLNHVLFNAFKLVFISNQRDKSS